MRNRTQSKLPAFLPACGLIFAGFLAVPPPSHASDIVAITDQYGHTVYINSDRATAPPTPLEFTGAQGLASDGIDSVVQRVADKYQMDPKLVRAIIRVESDYNPKAVSSKGAMGLMQLIPATAERFGVENPFDIKQNIQGGVSYLKYLMHLFGGSLPLSLAAYNAGEKSVIRSGGIPAIPETQQYVRKITRLYHGRGVDAVASSNPFTTATPPITRYVDQEGVVHFTNVE